MDGWNSVRMPKSVLRLGSVSVMALALAAGLAACGSSGGGGAASKGPIVIGVNDNLRGSLAQVGAQHVAEAQAAAAYFNAQGGIGGRTLKVQSFDAGEIGSGGAAPNTLQVQRAGALVMFGPTTSGDCEAAQPIVDKAQIPFICTYPNIDQITSPNSYVFGSNPPLTMAMSSVVSLLKKQTGLSALNVAYLGNYTPSSVTMPPKLKAVGAQNGVKVIYSDTMPQTATSVSSYVSQIAAAKPNGVVIAIFPNFVAPFVEGLRGAGYTGPIVTIAGVADYGTLHSVNDPGLFVQTVAPWLQPGASTNTPIETALLAQLAKAGLTTPEQINAADGGTSFTAFLATLNALKACGANCTGAQLREKMFSTPYNAAGFAENFAFTPDLHQGFRSYHFYTVHGGNVVEVPGDYPLGTIGSNTP